MSAILSLYSTLFSDYSKSKIEKKKSQLCLSLLQEESHSASVFSYRKQIGSLLKELTDLIGQGPSSWGVLDLKFITALEMRLIAFLVVFRDCSCALPLLHQ